jgi:hypothetical protein
VGKTGVGISLHPFECVPESDTAYVEISETSRDTKDSGRQIIITIPSGSKKHLQSFTDQMRSINDQIAAIFKDNNKIIFSMHENVENSRDFAVALALVILCQCVSATLEMHLPN